MKKVRLFQRKDRPGWHIAWYEGKVEKKRSFPNKTFAEHYRAIKYHELNIEYFRTLMDITWSDLVARYLRTYDVRQLSKKSKYEAELTLRHFEDLFGPNNSKTISQDMIDEYIIVRAEKLSPWTLNKEISNLRAFINWGQKNSFLPKLLEIHKVKTTPRIPVALTSQQIQSLLNSAKQRSECWYIRVLLAITTGLRSGDIDKLTVRDIDFESHTCITRSRKTRKAMADRPIHSDVIPILTKFIGNLPDGQVRILDADSNTHKKWKVIRKRAGLPELRFHDLRSVFSNALQQKDVPLSVVQELLEHSSPELTQKTYTNAGPMLAPAVERLPVKEWLL